METPLMARPPPKPAAFPLLGPLSMLEEMKGALRAALPHPKMAAGVAALQAGTPTGGAVQNLQPRDFTATPEYGQLCPATLAVDDSMHGKQACCMLDKALGAMEVFNDARKCSGKYIRVTTVDMLHVY